MEKYAKNLVPTRLIRPETKETLQALIDAGQLSASDIVGVPAYSAVSGQIEVMGRSGVWAQNQGALHTFSHNAAVEEGVPVIKGRTFTVPAETTEESGTYAGYAAGVFLLPKANADSNVAAGAPIYWDVTNDVATSVGKDAGPLIGYAAAAASGPGNIYVAVCNPVKRQGEEVMLIPRSENNDTFPDMLKLRHSVADDDDQDAYYVLLLPSQPLTGNRTVTLPNRDLNFVNGFAGTNHSYVSAELTGTGSSQNHAHGQSPGIGDGTPALVWVVVTAGHDGAGGAGTQYPTIGATSGSSTDLTTTVSAGAKFRFHAIW